MAWIESHDGIWEHHKTIRLCRILSIGKAQAVGHLHALWHFVLRNAWRDANLEPWGDVEIEKSMFWEGEGGALISALREVGFLDGFVVHGWVERAGRLVNDRLRNEQRRGDVRSTYGQRTSDVRPPGATVPNPTQPNQTVPYQKQMSGWFEEIWAKYPKRDGRKAAERHFLGSVKTEDDWNKIQQALGNYLKSGAVLKGFVKNGSTWFNNWKDWIDYTEPKGVTNGNGTGTGKDGYTPGKYAHLS